MPTKSGGIGGSSWVYLKNAQSIGITMGANEYPTAITFNGITQSGGSRWYNGWNRSNMTVYLCDSSGNNRYELFTVSFNSEGFNYTTNSKSGLSCKNLKGKALYIVGVPSDNRDADYICLRGYTSVTLTYDYDSFNVSVASVTGGSAAVSPTSATPGSTITISPSASTGYQYSGFNTNVTVTKLTSTTFTMPASAVTVTPVFSKINYTVSKASNPSDGGTVSLGKTTANYGDVVTVGATPATGYQLSSWSTSVSGVNVSNSRFTMPASNITITANFTKIDYDITINASPAAGGTPTASKNPANYGDVITLSHNRAAGYLFDGWTCTDATIEDSQFTMPAKAVTVTARYHIGRSTAEASKKSVAPGETIILSVEPESSYFYHKYKLSFGIGMETDWVTMAAGVETAEIYIPLAWSRMMKTQQRTGGTLTVQTYESDNTFMGEYVIDGMTYSALGGVIPKLVIQRADDADTPNIKGTKARYAITLPTGIDGFSLTCDDTTVENPTRSGLLLPGSTMTFATNTSTPVELEVEFGDETFTLTESVPSVWLLSKSVG